MALGRPLSEVTVAVCVLDGLHPTIVSRDATIEVAVVIQHSMQVKVLVRSKVCQSKEAR